MAKRGEQHLSRRERQIMDVIYAKGQATALEVTEAIPDPPGKTAVRTLLRILEEKGYLTHQQNGQTYLFQPKHPREHAGPSALPSQWWRWTLARMRSARARASRPSSPVTRGWRPVRTQFTKCLSSLVS